MTGAGRPNQEGVPLTPKSRKQKARPKISPNRKKATTAVQTSNPPRLPAFTTNQKRSRPATSPRVEPDVKRAKSITGAAAAAVAAAAARERPKSPTSSRSRQRKSSKSRGASDDTSSASNVITAATSSIRRPKPRVAQRSAPVLAPPPSSLFTVENTPIPCNVMAVSQPQRLFGYEIQSLMHAFGEVRHCSRPVLELMEDAVRSVVHRVAQRACDLAADERCEVALRHVAHFLRRDPHATQRLNESMKNVSEQLPAFSLDKPAVATPRPWEMILQLGELEAVDAPPEKLSAMNDLHSLCIRRALQVYRLTMAPQQFKDFLVCRGTSLVLQDSRTRTTKVRGVQKIALFKEWLCQKGNALTDEALYALGHVTWEVIGAITQSSLVLRYYDDLAQGIGDPRSAHWSYSRHLIEALGHGVGTAILVPLTYIQSNSLRKEVESYASFLKRNMWKSHTYASSPCLLPKHVKEALRRLPRAPDNTVGFGDSRLDVWGA